MSELVSALTQAAAEADWAAHNAAVLKVVRQSGGLDEKRRSISRARSAAVVAAVLETLAADRQAEIDRCGVNPPEACSRCRGSLFHIEELRRLAAETREEVK